MSRATFEEVYTGRMEKYVEPSRRPLIQSLVADQIAAIRVITKILEVIESTDNIDCYMKKPDISCSPRCIMEGGGIIYKTRDNIPHSVVTNSGIINFTSGFHYTNNSLKVLLISSQNFNVSKPLFSAALWIFNPCSSVPVKK